jgi:glycosyltransferase involved in cell wall biosynthesis
MATLAEPPRAQPDQKIASASWRAEIQRRQEEVLPPGRVVVSCSAPLGRGGLGRHLQEIVEALDRRGQTGICISGSERPPVVSGRFEKLGRRALNTVLSLPPIRSAASRRVLRHSREFDVWAAAEIRTADHLIAFNGTSLEQFRAAKRLGGMSTAVVSATSHFRLLIRQHERAHRQYPLEESWATRLLERNLDEYAEADRIYVASTYARDSFLAEGFSEDVLAWFPLTPSPRFAPDDAPRDSSTFDIVFVGGLSVVKGVPLLIDAVRALPHTDIRLSLVGGWRSRGMRRFVERACDRDRRIVAGHGDPLSRLHGARLCVHPTYNDGFAYAPAEALACRVPVLVSEDTGMKELVNDGVNGMVLPTGDLQALTESIDAAYRGEIFN